MAKPTARNLAKLRRIPLSEICSYVGSQLVLKRKRAGPHTRDCQCDKCLPRRIGTLLLERDTKRALSLARESTKPAA
jgi:hypothetical protein